MKKKTDNTSFAHRKQDHIRLALQKKNRAGGGSGFSSLHLMHCALPEINFDEVDISTFFFNQKLQTPFVVSGMTAGWPGAKDINHRLARVCEKRGWIMGVGSQRRQLTDPQSRGEWLFIRDHHKSLVLMGNIGLSQLIQHPVEKMKHLISSLKAQALVVHTNPLQEALQPEGTPQFRGGLKALKQVVQEVSVPVILKETGCGFSKQTLEELTSVKGLYAVDLSGYGGTHWGRIEGERVPKDHILYGAARAFKHWGIPTVKSLLMASEVKKNYQVWASGGMVNGGEAAKALALGADRIALAGPVIKAALKGEEALNQMMARMEYELKVALFCCGKKSIKEMRHCPHYFENEALKI